MLFIPGQIADGRGDDVSQRTSDGGLGSLVAEGTSITINQVDGVVPG